MRRRAQGGAERAREDYLTGAEPAPGGVRAEIAASWERSRRAGLDATRFEVPWVGDDDPDDDRALGLVDHARPVLDDLAERIAGSVVAIVLCDAQGRLLDRRVGDDGLRRRLDAIRLAPGFSYAERHAGTNGVGTALSGGAPTLVVGAEHYTDLLQPFACAGAPVHGPDGSPVGVLDLTCPRDRDGDLLRLLAHRAARDITARMRERRGAGPRAVMAAFHATCRRHAGPVLAVGTPGDDFLLLNTAARRDLSAPERDEVAAVAAARVLARRGRAPEWTTLPGGTVRLLALPVTTAGTEGVVVVVSRIVDGPVARGTRRRLSPLEAAERDLIADALRVADGNRVRAAAALGIGRTTLYRRLRAFGLTDVGR